MFIVVLYMMAWLELIIVTQEYYVISKPEQPVRSVIIRLYLSIYAQLHMLIN